LIPFPPFPLSSLPPVLPLPCPNSLKRSGQVSK
jgi:hypothetical protein